MFRIQLNELTVFRLNWGFGIRYSISVNHVMTISFSHLVFHAQHVHNWTFIFDLNNICRDQIFMWIKFWFMWRIMRKMLMFQVENTKIFIWCIINWMSLPDLEKLEHELFHRRSLHATWHTWWGNLRENVDIDRSTRLKYINFTKINQLEQ